MTNNMHQCPNCGHIWVCDEDDNCEGALTIHDERCRVPRIQMPSVLHEMSLGPVDRVKRYRRSSPHNRRFSTSNSSV